MKRRVAEQDIQEMRRLLAEIGPKWTEIGRRLGWSNDAVQYHLDENRRERVRRLNRENQASLPKEEQARRSREYREKNRDRFREYMREYMRKYLKDPEHRMKATERHRRWRARKRHEE